MDPYPFSVFIANTVLVSQVVGICVLLSLIFFRKSLRSPLAFIANNSTLLALIVAVVAVASSMTYSDIFHMAPCKLCWYQRIFIFPQVILLSIALWKKHHDIIVPYVVALTLIAIPISIFHYSLQMIDAPALLDFAPCDVTGQAPSCSSFYVRIHGYLTIPMMALTTSSLILLTMITRKVMRNV